MNTRKLREDEKRAILRALLDYSSTEGNSRSLRSACVALLTEDWDKVLVPDGTTVTGLRNRPGGIILQEEL